MEASPRIVPLAPVHARAAAELHIAGQPGTFLTSLGPGVLTVLYDLLPQSGTGFGFAALDAADDRVLGFISATTGVGRLFLELGTRRINRFLPPLLREYARRPQLALRTVQTAAYPLLVSSGAGDAGAAELLSIMVEPAHRGHAIGGTLLNQLVDACSRQSIPCLDVTVDSANQGARRFYARHAFLEQKEFLLYGRTMCLYRRTLGAAHNA